MKCLILALALMGCDLDAALDNSEPEPEPTVIRPYKFCASDSAQGADTATYMWCGRDPQPTQPRK